MQEAAEAMKIFILTIVVIMCLLISAGCTTSQGNSMMHFNYYHILRVSDYPLFTADGGVNQHVLDSLMQILNDPCLDPMLRSHKAYWPTGMTFDYAPYTAITAADFSNFVVPQPTCMNNSGAIIIQLFETITGRYGVEHGHITEFTSQWWQLVYRATDDENDVLTLWMVEPYRLTHFNGTRYDALIGTAGERFVSFCNAPGWRAVPENFANTIKSDLCIAMYLAACDTYFFEGNYSASIARSNLQRDMKHLQNIFNVEKYLVSPKNIPGQWQSSRYQTGTNHNGMFYVSGQFQKYQYNYSGSDYPACGLGATGLIWSSNTNFSLMNGKDGLSIGPFYGNWPHTQVLPTYYDLLWLPSDFETRSMGHEKDNALFQTFIAEPDNPYSQLRWNYYVREYDPRQDYAQGRSGLWRLNGFDRAFNPGIHEGWEARLVWLRSADTLSIGGANTVYYTGNRYSCGVNQLAGMRPALHLSMTRLNETINCN